MDAAPRKEAWTNIEDKMWELETRFNWLLKKVQDGRTGNFMGQFRDTQNEDQDNIYTESPNGTTEDVSKSLIHLLYSLVGTMGHVIEQMSVIRKWMWVNWEDDSVSESFYDFCQISSRLVECLSLTWIIAMSMFRSTKIDILCLSEKIADQIASSYQLAVKSFMSCWEGHLAVCNRQNPSDISNAQVRVRCSCSIVGAGFSRALLASNKFTLNIGAVLKESATVRLHELVHRKEEENREHEDKRMTRYEYLNYKESSAKSSEEKSVKSSSEEEFNFDKNWKKYAFQKIPNLKQFFSRDEAQNQSPAHHVTYPQDASNQEQYRSVKNVCCCQRLHCSCSAVSASHIDKTDPSAEEPKKENDCNESSVKCSLSSNASELWPSFASEEWKTILGELKDLRVEIRHLLDPVTQLKFEENIIKNLVSITKNEVAAEVKESLKDLFSDVVSAQLVSLDALEEELNVQINVWEAKEASGLLRSLVKGFDPEEAYLQAKNLLNLHTYAFFSLMLLIETHHIHRLTYYSALLCESLTEALTLTPGLVQSRVEYGRKSNPYTLSHQLSKALKCAHAFCDGLFTDLSLLCE